MFFILLVGLALVQAQTTSSGNQTNTTITVHPNNSSQTVQTNTTNVPGGHNVTNGTIGQNSTVVNSTSTNSTGQSSVQSSTESSSTESQNGTQSQTSQESSQESTSTQSSSQGQQGKSQGKFQQGKSISGRNIPCRVCGAACSSSQIINGICNIKLKCIARKAMPPNCGRPSMTSMSGQGQLTSSSMGSTAMMNGQLNSMSLGQGQMTSLNGQFAALSACPPMNCPMIPACNFPAILQSMPMANGCLGCPTCVIPGGCTVDSQCSKGTYCVLGRCLTYAQEGDACGVLTSPMCQPPLVCTVMGTCYMPDCSCGFLPCPLSEQIVTQPDVSLVTGGCPPCPTCRS